MKYLSCFSLSISIQKTGVILFYINGSYFAFTQFYLTLILSLKAYKIARNPSTSVSVN